MSARDILKLIYKIGMIGVTVTLVALAYLAYRTATPGNGQLLISGMLAMGALLAFLSISKLDWQDEQAETYRGILSEMRTRFPLTIRFAKARMGTSGFDEFVGNTGSGERVSVSFAEPEVHRIDDDQLAEARRMAADGRPIDDICRMIDPGHDQHDPMHREAFRRMVRAVIEKK